LLSPKGILKIVGYINRRFNKTKAPKRISYAHGYAKVKLNYSMNSRIIFPNTYATEMLECILEWQNIQEPMIVK